MNGNARDIRTPLSWIMPPVALVAASLLVAVFNRPGTARTDVARRELAAAGHLDVQLDRAQTPSNLSRCEVGQIRNRGYAYGWRDGSHSGLFCLRADGRPNRIIVD